ncbi:MAG: dihydroneopterin aldolase [Clostridia bacterium]|nr:dihydroneopterin aldolase [Clostridia bacterium]
MDKILIEGLRVFAYHGVFPQEKREGQTFVLDITMGLDLTKAGETDDLADTINYAEATAVATQAMTAESYDLIERAAARVAAALLAAFPPVAEVTVRLHKPQAPVEATFAAMAVEITRKR